MFSRSTLPLGNGAKIAREMTSDEEGKEVTALPKKSKNGSESTSIRVVPFFAAGAIQVVFSNGWCAICQILQDTRQADGLIMNDFHVGSLLARAQFC